MPKAVWILIIGTFLNSIGSAFLWPLNSIYVHDYLGKSLSVAGFVMMISSLAGIIGNLVGGYLFDKFGGYRAIVVGATLNILGLVGMYFWHEWPWYVVFLTCIGFSGAVVYPMIYALVGQAWPTGGRKAFNSIFLAANVGVAIGPALAGLVADISFEYVFTVNLAVYAVFFVFVITTFKRFKQTIVEKEHVETARVKNERPGFMAIGILSIALVICWIGYSQWSATISTYTQSLQISLTQYSLLWTINGVLIVAVQPVIRPILKRWENKLKHQLVLGMILMGISYGVVYFAEDFTFFAVAMVLLTLGEVFFTPVLPTIANKLAPKGRKGFYQGVVNAMTALGRTIGPLVGGIMVDLYGMQMLMFIFVILFALALIPCMLFDRPLNGEFKERSSQ